MGESKFPKSWTLAIQIFKPAGCLQKWKSSCSNGKLCLHILKLIRAATIIYLIQHFEAEGQPQNPEFRINFHLWWFHFTFQSSFFLCIFLPHALTGDNVKFYLLLRQHGSLMIILFFLSSFTSPKRCSFWNNALTDARQLYSKRGRVQNPLHNSATIVEPCAWCGVHGVDKGWFCAQKWTSRPIKS